MSNPLDNVLLNTGARQRFSVVIREIMDYRRLSQARLGQEYLGVSQSCIRDYVYGKVHPLAIRTLTMQRVSHLYGVPIDDLLHYLINGSWKRSMSYQNLESSIRSITNIQVLSSLLTLVTELIKKELDKIETEPTTDLEQEGINQSIVDMIETERARVNTPAQWISLLESYGIGEPEIISLHQGNKPDLNFLVRLSSLLRCDIDELQTKVELETKEEAAAPLEEQTAEENGFATT
jgi:predicted XRE-type DNA-binding protein